MIDHSVNLSDLSDVAKSIDDEVDDFFGDQAPRIVDAHHLASPPKKPEEEFEPLPLFDCLFCTRHQDEYLRRVNNTQAFRKYAYQFLDLCNFEPIEIQTPDIEAFLMTTTTGQS
jgi:hypothetical protein